MKLLYKFFLIILIVCIPITSVLAASNIVFRMPDLYKYEFTNSEISSDIDLEITEEELSGFFSDFMFGKKADFDLNAEFRGREQSVFGTGEQIAMENARSLLNNLLIGFGVTLALTLIIYSVFLMRKLKYELRTAFKAGLIIFAILGVISLIVFNLPVADVIVQSIFVYKFGADDVLPLMLNRKFAGDGLAAIFVVASVILAIIGSVTWKLTKPRRMFW